MRLSRALLPVLATAIAAAPVVYAVEGPSSTTAATMAFSPALPLYDDAGVSTGGSEPSIEIDSKGNVYVSAPAGVPTGGCPFWNVHPDRLNEDGLPYEYRGTIDTDRFSVGGGDCDISITDNPGGAYDTASVTSLSLANLTSNRTSDGGETFVAVANPASQQVFGVDRQWQASDRGLGRHYLTVHDLATNNIQVAVSVDGGYQYVQNVPAIDPVTTPQGLGTAVYFRNTSPSGNSFGTTVVDPTTHKLYIPFIAAGPGNAGAVGHAVYIAEGDPCAVAPCEAGMPAGPITWKNHLVYEAPEAFDLSAGFPAIAIDRAGVVYLAWTGDADRAATTGSGPDSNRVFLSYSKPGAVGPGDWSAPAPVDPGTGHSNLFPWMVAGDAGQVAVAWYSSVLGSTCAGSAGPTSGVNDDCRNVWNVSYAASSAASSAEPAWTVVDASRGPIHHGAICDQGLSCPDGTRTLLDFFDMALDPQGRPHLAYASDIRSPGTADVHYTRLCSGPGLTGSSFDGPCEPIGVPDEECGADAAYTDPEGDATNVLGASTPLPSDPALDVVGGRLTTEPDGVRLEVTLGDLEPGAVGQIVEQHFVIDNKEYYVMSERATDGSGVTHVYGDMGSATGGRRQLGTTTGTFDDATNTVSALFPRTATAAPLADGTAVTGVVVTTRRDGVLLIPDADVATGACRYTVGAVVVEPTGTPTPDATGSATPTTSPTPTSNPTPSGDTTPTGDPTPTTGVTPSPTCTPKGNGGNNGNGGCKSKDKGGSGGGQGGQGGG